MKSGRTRQPSRLERLSWLLHLSSCSSLEQRTCKSNAARCSSDNLGRPRSNCSWWILTFGGLTRSSVAKSSDRAHRGHGIHFRLLRHNNLLFELLLLYMLDESWEIKMGKAKPLMRGAQINSFTLEVVPGQRRAREIRDWAVIQCGRLSRSSRCTHHLSHQETTQSQRLHGERMVRGGCGEHKW